MRLFMLLVFLIFPLTSTAGLVLGIHGGQGKDNGKGIENFNGPLYGGRIGWRWNFFSLEYAMSSYSLSAKRGQSKDFFIDRAKADGSVSDILARFYLFKYVSLFAGITSLSLDFDIHLTNVKGDSSRSITSEGDSYTSGSILGAGVHIPFGKGFEVFGAYAIRKWNPIGSEVGLNDEAPSIAIHEWHAGLLWHWDTGRGRRRK